MTRWKIITTHSIILGLRQKNMGNFSFLLCLMVLVASGFVYNGDAKEQKLGIYELKRGNFSAKFTNWGAAIVSVVVPDRHGKLADIALGYDTIKEYINGTQSFGAVVGRVANRIAGAKFTLNGIQYKLIANDGNNTLHGGPKGFGKVAWRVSKYKKDGQTPHIVFTYRSVDGDQGFPGDLVAVVSYTLLGKNHLSVSLKAKALNKPTPVNLAQHVYWNLGGHNSGNILSNRIQIFGSQITPVDSQLIPTGKFSPVQGTPYDFLKPATVGSRINKLPKGYDINYVLENSSGKFHHKLKKVAIVHDDKSGRVLELLTNAPGVQFYTGNFLKNEKGKGGAIYQAHAALCLETQAFPDSVNQPNFPSTIIHPGKPYDHYMLFKFSTI